MHQGVQEAPAAATPPEAPTGAAPRRHGFAVIYAASGLALLIWLASGAYTWQGYPVDHPWGLPVTAVIALAGFVVFASIARLACSPLEEGFKPVAVALAGWTICRLTLTSLFPLISDEAYHWMWAKYLDLGYYDHPGMVAWMGRLFMPFHGYPAAAARFASVCQSILIVLLVYGLAKAVTGSARVAARSALLFMLIPMFALGFVMVIPSVAVNLFWLAALIFTWRASQRDRQVDWVLAGLSCGMACNGNFTSFALPVSILAYLVVSPARRLLLRPGPYVAVLMAAVAFIPTLIWNHRHDWITITWNLYKRHDPPGIHLDYLGVYLGELLVFLSPLLTILLVWVGLRAAWTGWRRNDQASLFLAVMGLSMIVGWGVIGTSNLIVAYYAAPGFAPLLILFVQRSLQRAEERPAPRMPYSYRWATGLASATTMFMFACVLVPTFVPPQVAEQGAYFLAGAAGHRQGKQRSPIEKQNRAAKQVGEVYGWTALGRYLDSMGHTFGAKSQTVLVAPSYAQAASAMFHSRSVEMAYSFDEGVGRYGQQFQFWAPRKNMPPGCDAVIFHAGRSDRVDQERQALLRCFARVEVADLSSGDPRLGYFTIYRAYGYKGGLDKYQPYAKTPRSRRHRRAAAAAASTTIGAPVAAPASARASSPAAAGAR